MMNRMKSIKILDEIIGYFLHYEIDDLDIRFRSSQTSLKICVSGQANAKPQDLEQLDTLLNAPRKPEYEEYYWALLGTGSNRSELRLLGSLVDKGRAAFENGRLTISVERFE